MKRLSEKEIFKTKVFTIKDIVLETTSGKKVTYQILEKKDTALIVPLLNNTTLLLTREYFYAIDRYQLSLPKGRIDEGESELQAANRELQEEIGFKSQNLVNLGELTMSPGYLTQKTHIFLARDLVRSKIPGDEEEEIEVINYPFSDFEKLIDEGKLTEARVIAALYLARRYMDKRK